MLPPEFPDVEFLLGDNRHDFALLLPVRVPHGERGLSRDAFLDAHHYPFSTLSYFAIAKDRLPEIRRRVAVVV